MALWSSPRHQKCNAPLALFERSFVRLHIERCAFGQRARSVRSHPPRSVGVKREMPTKNRPSSRRGGGSGSASRRSVLVTIKSSGGVTRAVNGVNAPEPSTLRTCYNNVALSEVNLPRRPPPSKDLIDALNEARRELMGIPPSDDDDDDSVAENSEDASPQVRRMTILPIPRTVVGARIGPAPPAPPVPLTTWRSVATSPPAPKYTVLLRKSSPLPGKALEVFSSTPTQRAWRWPPASLSRESSNASSSSDSIVSNVPYAHEDTYIANDISAWPRDPKMFYYTHANPPPTCPHCKVLLVTFACAPCGHADSCFACAFYWPPY